MSKTSLTSIGITVTGDGENATYQAPIITNVAAVYGGQLSYALASGFNALSVPTGAMGLLITPPVTSTIVKTLKGITGDTGLILSAVSPTFLSLDSTQTTVGIDASGTETVLLHWT